RRLGCGRHPLRCRPPPWQRRRAARRAARRRGATRADRRRRRSPARRDGATARAPRRRARGEHQHRRGGRQRDLDDARMRLVRIARVACALLAAVVTGAGAATIERTLVVGKQERSYAVDVPARAAPPGGWPVVLVFHGGGGNAASVRTQSGMSELGAAEGFVAVYPQGSGGIAGKLKTW